MTNNQSVLLIQEYDTTDGLRYVVWKAPLKYLDIRKAFVEEGESPESATRKAFTAVLLDGEVELMGVTEQDAALLAANLREEGCSARILKDQSI